jgi:hypothetical protein
MENSDSVDKSRTFGFRNYEKNEAFPIHADIQDSEVDAFSLPGGYIPKHIN